VAVRGRVSFEAADAVRPITTPTIDTLATLVTRSVVTADTTATPTRYRLLQTLRAFSQGQDPDPASTHEAHAGWVRDLVERRVVEFTTRRAGIAMRQLTRELPNLRAAIAHDLAHNPAAALHTVSRLNWFWQRGGHGGETIRLLDAALLATPDASPLELGYAASPRPRTTRCRTGSTRSSAATTRSWRTPPRRTTTRTADCVGWPCCTTRWS
jgi:hypothetical protein